MGWTQVQVRKEELDSLKMKIKNLLAETIESIPRETDLTSAQFWFGDFPESGAALMIEGERIAIFLPLPK